MDLAKQLIAMAVVGIIGTSAVAQSSGHSDIGQNAVLCQYDGHLGFLLDPDIPAIWTWGTYAPVSILDIESQIEKVPVKEVAEVFRLRVVNLEIATDARANVDFVVRVSKEGMILRTEPPISHRFYGIWFKRALCERYHEGQG